MAGSSFGLAAILLTLELLECYHPKQRWIRSDQGYGQENGYSDELGQRAIQIEYLGAQPLLKVVIDLEILGDVFLEHRKAP